MSDNQAKIITEKLQKKVKSFLVWKNVLAFSLFLLLSTCLWFVHALDGIRKTEVKVAVNYIGIPSDVELQQTLPQEIAIVLHDEGRKLFAYNRKHHSLTISFDLSEQMKEKVGSVMICPEQLRIKLSEILQPTSRLLEFAPDTLRAEYVRLQSKMVPVCFVGKIYPAKQYRISGDVRLTPSQIMVYGPSAVLDTLRYLPLEYTDLQDVKDTIVADIAVQKITSLRYETPMVQAQVCSEMFTEKSFILPIVAQNFPENLIVRTFPSEVTVVFNVDVSQFATIQAADLNVIFDARKIIKEKEKQTLQVKYQSPHIFNVRVIPEEVEFLLEKK